MSFFTRTCATFALLALVAATTVRAGAQSVAPSPSAVPAASIAGVVADAQSALPLPNATVSVVGTPITTTTDAHGAFHIDGLAPAIYHLRVSHSGYTSAESDDIVVAAASGSTVTLALNATLQATSGGTIGRTGTRASQSLQQSSTISRTRSNNCPA
jgi:hypothetical protein